MFNRIYLCMYGSENIFLTFFFVFVAEYRPVQCACVQFSRVRPRRDGSCFSGPRACRGDDECRIIVIRHNCHVTCINAKCYKTRNVRFPSVPPPTLLFYVPRKKKNDPFLLLRLYRLGDIPPAKRRAFLERGQQEKKMKKITSV